MTNAELEVLRDCMEGLTAEQSAFRRGKSPWTVRTQRMAVRNILRARTLAQAVAIYLREGHMAALDVYQREDGLWDYRVIGGNGEQVGESSQGFTSKADAERGFGALTRAVLELLAASQ